MGKMTLPFIDSYSLYRGAFYGRFDCIHIYNNFTISMDIPVYVFHRILAHILRHIQIYFHKHLSKGDYCIVKTI